MYEVLKSRFPTVQGYIVSNPADIFYLTGFFCEDSVLLYGDDSVLFTDRRYEVASKVSCCPVCLDGGTVENVLKEAKKRNISCLAVQEDIISAKDCKLITDSGITPVFAGNVFSSFRSQKTDAEVEKIQAAQNITDKAFEKLLDYIKPGVTEKQLRARLEYLLYDFGADGLAFDTVVVSGKNGAKPHGVPTDKKIQKGEFITFDFGARKDNYDSDMTRTVALGQISSEMRKIYNGVLEAHEVSAELLQPGAVCRDVDKKARQVLEKYKLEKYFAHSLGHGVGIEIHELPNLSPRCDTVLDVGHIVTVEPGVYLEDFCGVRIENMYTINRFGKKNLTGTDKKLINL